MAELNAVNRFSSCRLRSVDPVGLLCPFTMVSLGADYRLRQDDIPKLQILLTYGHSPRTTLHSTSVATASAKLPAESPGKSYHWAVGFFFGNVELSLELWTVISGIPGFDD